MEARPVKRATPTSIIGANLVAWVFRSRVFSDSSAGFKKHLTFAVCHPILPAVN